MRGWGAAAEPGPALPCPGLLCPTAPLPAPPRTWPQRREGAASSSSPPARAGRGAAGLGWAGSPRQPGSFSERSGAQGSPLSSFPDSSRLGIRGDRRSACAGCGGPWVGLGLCHCSSVCVENGMGAWGFVGLGFDGVFFVCFLKIILKKKIPSFVLHFGMLRRHFSCRLWRAVGWR